MGLLGILLLERDHRGHRLHGKSERTWASSSQIQRLPERSLNEEDLKRNGEEASAKCMVCLAEYETGDAVRTMPCRKLPSFFLFQ